MKLLRLTRNGNALMFSRNQGRHFSNDPPRRYLIADCNVNRCDCSGKWRAMRVFHFHGLDDNHRLARTNLVPGSCVNSDYAAIHRCSHLAIANFFIGANGGDEGLIVDRKTDSSKLKI